MTGSITAREAAETLRPVNVLDGEELQSRLQGTVAARLVAEGPRRLGARSAERPGAPAKLSDQVPSVDGKHGARDVAGGFGAQEEHDRGDVLRVAQAA